MPRIALFRLPRQGAVYKKPERKKKPFVISRRHVFVGLTTFTLCIALGGFAFWVSRPATLPIRNIEIGGVDHGGNITLRYVDSDVVNAKIKHLVATGFFRANLDEIQAIVHNLPWVRKTYIQRSWPDTVRIQITEYQPVAYWQTIDGPEASVPLLLDEDGRVFTANTDQLPALPVLSGPPGEQDIAVRLYQEVAVPLASERLEVSSLAYHTSVGWRLTLQTGLTLQLGHQPDIRALERFVLIYREQLVTHLARIASVDLRYAQGVAVQWKISEKGNHINPENSRDTNHFPP